MKMKQLREGDMVFFNINNRRGGRASHVGVYLKNGLFVHTYTTRNGVIISSLSRPYYRHISWGRACAKRLKVWGIESIILTPHQEQLKDIGVAYLSERTPHATDRGVVGTEQDHFDRIRHQGT